MAELLLGAVLPTLVEYLVSPALLNLAKREKVVVLIEKWSTKLTSISRLLEDAEDKAMRGDGNVKVWLHKLRDLVYDIEDVVDEFVTEENIRNSSSTESAVTGNKVRSLLPSCCTGLSPRKLMLDHQLRSKMEKIGDRLDAILEQKKDLELSESSGSSINNTSSHSSQRVTTSVQESYVVGREKDEKDVLSKLAEETEDLSVIPVVGIGGLGKTTLAKSVFNHSDVKQAFPLRGWACVSDNFDKLGIARALLGSLTGGSDGNGDDLNVLHNKLREILSKQKFLMVLDDYWNTNYSNWCEMCDLFNPCVKGSKVIVTTRDLCVASMTTDQQPIRLQQLSPSDCLSLLAYHAFGINTFDAHNNHLKPIGEEIAQKCKGLPLAAKALGGLLRSKPRITTEWEDIRYSKIWNVESGKDDIFLTLKLSYIHLPSHLKRCFVYCAIFSQDHEFDRDELVLLWMSEGFVEMKGSNTRRGKLDQGRKQFDELLNRSFFQRSTRDESKFVMHDLMHDLALSIGGNTCLNVKLEHIGDVSKDMSPEKVHHLLYYSRSTYPKFEKFHVLKSLRTFHSVKGSLWTELVDKPLEELLKNLKYLRTLSLRGYEIHKIPNCITSLNRLRYLNFSNNSSIEELPKSICTLYNLEVLILRNCFKLTALPPGMDKLINLKCLDISETLNLMKMPLRFGDTHNFEILTKFIVGREDSLSLKALRHSPHLQGELSILGLQNVEDTRDARDAGLNAKDGLTTLALVWGLEDDSGSCCSRNRDKEKEVIELLRPHQKIKEVEINGYGGTSFPLWVGSPSMTNMTRIRLDSCATVTTLSSFGLLPCLRELAIRSMDALCCVGSEFYGNTERPFQSLEVLSMYDMRAWEVWSSSWGDKEIEEPFPRLIRLELQKCPRLVSNLPHWLCSIVDLKIIDCPLLQASPSMFALSSLKKLYLQGCHYDLLAMISSASTNSLTSIYLEGIKKLLYLNEDTLRLVKYLRIEKCEELIGLWEDNVSDVVRASLTRLEYLTIVRCRNLKKLPNNMQRLTSLTEMTIEHCPRLESIPEGIMNCNLKTLWILFCRPLKVAKLPTSLVNFKVSGCELELLDDSSASTKAMRIHLEEVVIDGSCNFKNITHFLFTNLTKLEVSNCPYLEDNMLLMLPSSLRSLQLSRCNNIKSLPHQMHTTFTSLQYLELYKLSIECFPEGGLPLSVEELKIKKCKELKQPLEEWGLYKLTALKRLYLMGEIGSLCLQEGMVTSFPPPHSDWTHFPSNLEILELSSQYDMVSLLDGLRDHLTSLRRLNLFACPKLQFLPKEGFPPSLEILTLQECHGDIEIKCSKNGEYFHLIESILGFYF